MKAIIIRLPIWVAKLFRIKLRRVKTERWSLDNNYNYEETLFLLKEELHRMIIEDNNKRIIFIYSETEVLVNPYDHTVNMSALLK